MTPNHHTLKQLGVGGLFAVVVLLVVFGFLSDRLSFGDSVVTVNPGVDRALHQIDQLYDWHNVRDGDGVRMASEMGRQSDLLMEVLAASRATVALLERIDRRQEKLGGAL